MANSPDEFGGIQQRLLETAVSTTQQQFDAAERIVAEKFPAVAGGARTRLLIAVVQAIATNYLGAATVRNLPKG
jgi:hypothetical protein